jgi:HPt (histidine-containing phosphotransfer) domain-containing protein
MNRKRSAVRQREPRPARLDLQRFHELTRDDPEFELEILDDYLRHTADLIESQRVAADAGDADTLEREARTMQGSSRQLGASLLVELGQQIEQFARSRDLERAVKSLDRAVREFEALQDELLQHVRRRAA